MNETKVYKIKIFPAKKVLSIKKETDKFHKTLRDCSPIPTDKEMMNHGLKECYARLNNIYPLLTKDDRDIIKSATEILYSVANRIEENLTDGDYEKLERF